MTFLDMYAYVEEKEKSETLAETKEMETETKEMETETKETEIEENENLEMNEEE